MPPPYALVRRTGDQETYDRACLAAYASECGGAPVLLVEGEPEAIGRQYGFLVGRGIARNVQRLVQLFAGTGVPEALVHRILDGAWECMDPFVSDAWKAEMAGVAVGAREAGVPLEPEMIRRLTAATNFDMYKRDERIFEFLGNDAEEITRLLGGTPMQCTMFAVWGSRTVGGKMLAMRNLDWLSQTGMHEDRLITVYRPEGRQCFVTMGYAGVLGALAGMNASGISFSQVGTFSASEELAGIPWTFLAREVLARSDGLEAAAQKIQRARHTIGYNYLVADGDPTRYGTSEYRPRAAAFETNHACCEVFYENDPKEKGALWIAPDGREYRYGLPLTEALMRADTAFGAYTRAAQAADDGPGDPENSGNPWGRDFSGSTYTTCHKPMYDMIRAYETGSEYVFPVRNQKVIEAGSPRKIGFEEALAIAGVVAHNVELLPENDWNIMSVVYAPTEGRFWVGYETRYEDGSWKNAPDAGYLEFDMREIMQG